MSGRMRRSKGGNKGIGRAVRRPCRQHLTVLCKANEVADHADIVSVAVMEWQVEEGDEKEVMDFYQSEAAPTIAASPDVLRFRMFKIKNATVLKAGSYETLEKKKLHTYLTLAELESEEWPWDVVIALGENPKWREYFDGQKIVVSRLCKIDETIAYSV